MFKVAAIADVGALTKAYHTKEVGPVPDDNAPAMREHPSSMLGRDGAPTQTAITHTWKELVQWNMQNPTSRAFVAAGDFNVKSGPTRSYIDPVSQTFAPGSLPAERSRGTQPLQAFWERLFTMVTEISTDCPTHFCRDLSTAATLD